MVASECAPVAQAGGLAEVVFGLSRELEWRGHPVEIILPKYDCLRYDQIFNLGVAYADLWVPWYSGAVHTTVWFGFVHGRRCYFIDPHCADNFFHRGRFYGDADDAARFAFFSKAALEFLYQSGRRPDVLHCHDWQTGLVPVLLYELYQQAGMPDPRVCYTIHNFGHQGVAGENLLWATGLTRPAHFYDPARLQDDFNPSAINLMKGGIVYSNFVTTVSPQHAWEAAHTDQGQGLGHTLHLHHGKFAGVLNGVDYDVWNPEIDPAIPVRYTADDVAGKYAAKAALRDRRRTVMSSVEHRSHKRLNNRAENFHQRTRSREQAMRRFKSPGRAQRFCSAHDKILSALPSAATPSGPGSAARMWI